MEKRGHFYIFFVTNLSLVIFPTLVRLQFTTEDGNLSMIANGSRTCTCPGDSVTFTCTTIGGEATLWSGSAFPNNCDIMLNHSMFSDTGRVSGFCSDQGIVGLGVEGINNRYTSQLTVPVNSDSINRTVKCTVIYNSTTTSLIGTEVIATTEPFPPPDDFRLRAIILQRLWFTWTINDTYRNCTSLTNIYITNCTSTCRFSSDRISIVCSGISTAAHICLFQLQYSICDDITGNASDPVYITLKVPEAPVIISAVISVSYLDINFTQAEEFPVSDEVNATINSYNVTIMQTSTGTICGSSRRYFVLCQKGFCIERVLIPSFCDGSAISIVISAINDFGSGPNSKPFNVQGIPGTYFDSITNSALQALIGGVVSGAGAIIGGLISVILAVWKLKDSCCQRGTETVCDLTETSTTKSITLQWNPPTMMSKGVTAYRVEYSENKPSSLKRSVEVSIEQTSFKITELLPGTEYQINVSTVTAKGTGTPTEIIATTKEQQYKLSIQVTFSIRNKTGALTSILNKMITQGFKIRQIESCTCQSERPRETECQFYVNADCICQVMEEKKQDMEKILKTKTCARRITIKDLEEAKVVADNEEQEVLEQTQRLPYCIVFKSTALHQALIEIVQQFDDLNVNIAHIESFESPDSNGVYIIRVECDFGNEKSKTELEARLKACSGVLDNNRFLTVSETHEAPIQTAKNPCECIFRINFPLRDTSKNNPLMSILQILQKQALSIMYVDSYEITSSPDCLQQYVAIEYVQQVQVDREKGTVIKELESLDEDASVEEIFRCDFSPESTDNQNFCLELTLEDSRMKTVALLKTLTDLGVYIDSFSSTVHQAEQNSQKCTLKCTTDSLQLIHMELVRKLNEIALNNQVNLQQLTSQVGDEGLAQSDDEPFKITPCPNHQMPQAVETTKL